MRLPGPGGIAGVFLVRLKIAGRATVFRLKKIRLDDLKTETSKEYKESRVHGELLQNRFRSLKRKLEFYSCDELKKVVFKAAS